MVTVGTTDSKLKYLVAGQTEMHKSAPRMSCLSAPMSHHDPDLDISMTAKRNETCSFAVCDKNSSLLANMLRFVIT